MENPELLAWLVQQGIEAGKSSGLREQPLAMLRSV